MRPQIARVRLFRQNLPLRNRLDEDRSFRDFRDRFPLEMAAVVFPREFFCPHGAVIGADRDFSEAFLPEDSFPARLRIAGDGVEKSASKKSVLKCALHFLTVAVCGLPP
ncbi:MAG: hypothetical protein V8T87_12115 [Victivallales bacterium]